VTTTTAIIIPAGQAVDAIRGDHIEGGVGDVDDAGHPEDQRETDGQQGQHAAGDETGNEYIHNASEEFIDRQIRDNRSSRPSPSARGGMGLIQHEACVIFSSRVVV
jgi:hypothetical protein